MQRRPLRARRFGPLGMALAGAGGFLAGVLLIAILGGAQPVYKERTLTVSKPLQGSAVPALVGQRLDVALDRLESAGLKGDVQGGGLFGVARRERLEGRRPGSLAGRAPRRRATPSASTSTGHDARAAAGSRRHARSSRSPRRWRPSRRRPASRPSASRSTRASWRSTPARARASSGTAPRCPRSAARIGISSWEALWCRYEGDDEELRALREWAPGFRRDAWRAALGRQGIEDDELAAELGERFGEERRARHETFEDAAPALDALRGDYRLALVTNGASCLQREKFEASGLADRFDAVVVSGDLRSAKPRPGVYAHALDARRRASRRRRHGRRQPAPTTSTARSAAGLRAIWLNRTGEPRPADRDDLVEIADLHALPGALA